MLKGIPVEGRVLMKIVRITKKLIRAGQNIDRIKVLAGLLNLFGLLNGVNQVILDL